MNTNVSYRVFTIESGSVRTGAVVEKFTLKGVQTDIPAILIGEEGRGRERGVLPVTLTASQHQEWLQKGRVSIQFAEPGTSQTGKPKLIARESGSDEKIIGVFLTKMGFRGGNSHTGDRKPSLWTLTYQGRDKAVKVIASAQKPEEFTAALPAELQAAQLDTYVKHTSHVKDLMVKHYALDNEDFEEEYQFEPFPGEKIIEGRIAEGGAGRMGSGRQLVAVLDKNVWFRTSYSGKLYGAPGSHYYKWDGIRVSALTWDERQTLRALVEDGAPLPVPPPAAVAEVKTPYFWGGLPKSNLFVEEDDDDEDGDDFPPAKLTVTPAAPSKTVTISIDLLTRLIAGNTDMDAVMEAAALLPKS